jgi:PAS domain-containing protein
MNTVVEWLFGAALRRVVDYRVAARMRDFAAAMRGANMHVFFQDRELRYKAVISLQRDGVGIELIGRTDEQVLPSLERNAVIAAKKKVIATGEAGDCEVSFVMPRGPAVFAVHIEPIRGSDSNIEGISCLAIDITRARSPESERRRSSDELKTTVQCYETALANPM